MAVESLASRAQLYAALGDPHRLAIVDELCLSDRSPSELAAMLAINSNLLAHHIGVLEQLGVVERVVSQGDGRRRYARLVPAGLTSLQLDRRVHARRIVFVCTENASRSQLAQAIWNRSNPVRATSAGTSPAARLHPGTLRAAARRGLDLGHARPRPLPELRASDLVVTVCDRAHETLRPGRDIRQLHWSIPDPAASAARESFDTAADTLAERITTLARSVKPR